jgi:hypothetical protein
MRDDGVIGHHLETLVGTVVGAHRIELHAIPDGVLGRLATEVRGWHFDEARFDALYEEYESALFAESFTYNLVVPLPGLTSDGLPIDLGEQACRHHDGGGGPRMRSVGAVPTHGR